MKTLRHDLLWGVTDRDRDYQVERLKAGEMVMTPTELEVYKNLPAIVTIYRTVCMDANDFESCLDIRISWTLNYDFAHYWATSWMKQVAPEEVDLCANIIKAEVPKDYILAVLIMTEADAHHDRWQNQQEVIVDNTKDFPVETVKEFF